jgi:anti-sigma factor RsiW
MTECHNAEIRDQLPDFVHDQLDAAARAAVAAHVSRCAACASELALLRQIRQALHVAPAVDIARIVATLPAPSAVRQARSDRGVWRRFDWRVAAAILALVVGGGSAAVLSMRSRDAGSGRPETVQGVPAAIPSQQLAADLSIDADLGEASVGELEALLEELDTFDGLPAGEPDVPVVSSNTGEEGP